MVNMTVTITVRYKDSVRDEIFLTQDETTILVNEISDQLKKKIFDPTLIAMYQ